MDRTVQIEMALAAVTTQNNKTIALVCAAIYLSGETNIPNGPRDVTDCAREFERYLSE